MVLYVETSKTLAAEGNSGLDAPAKVILEISAASLSYGLFTLMERLMIRKTSCAFLFLLSGSLPAQATDSSLVASPFSPYNALVFGDFVATASDVEGNVAVGGNLETTDYSFGAALDPRIAEAAEVLFVAGDAELTRTRVYFGDFVHGGDAQLTNTGVDGQTQQRSDVSLDSLESSFQMISSSLAGLATTGTANSQHNKLTLSGDHRLDTNVFTVSPDLWKNADGGDVTVIDLDIPLGSTAIINVAGDSVHLSNMGFDDVVAAQPSPFRHTTLFNFFAASEVTLQNIGLEGALLAPWSSVKHRDGVIYGQVVAGSFEGNGQVDLEPFSGTLPVVVPEPVGCWIWALLLLCLRQARYRG